MNIHVRRLDSVIVVDIEGPMMDSTGAEHFHSTLKKLAADGHSHFVLNLRKVPHISSIGIGWLVTSYASVVRKGGMVKIANAGERVHHVLDICTRGLFEFFDSEEEAASSFRMQAK